jgi:glycosyltransferase involved in cell wall biosynthesis
MACGVPVAAFPAAAPIDVIGNSKAGLLSENLTYAAQEALKIPRKVARAHAESYSWEEATRMFLKHQAEI